MQQTPADFPQTWQRPAYQDLRDCLGQLKYEPPIWNPSTSRKVILSDHENNVRFRREVAAYLASIIKSDLRWLGDDAEREVVWEEASRRLAERCGRAGMGEITRRWPFFEGDEEKEAFELVVREPPMAGDSLGLKTWGSSYLLAQQLDEIRSRYLSHLLPADPSGLGPSSVNVLELGSGTGLLGLAAARIWKTEVYLSDLPDIVPNLSHNAQQNRGVIEEGGGGVEAGALTWGGSSDDNSELFSEKNRFEIVLVADPLYDDDHPELLYSAIDDNLKRDKDARLIVMIPLRDEPTRELLSAFQRSLIEGEHRWFCPAEGVLFGQDDWEKGHEEYWWSIFARP